MVEGFRFLPEVTREAVLIVASAGLLAVWGLALRIHGSRAVAFWTLVLTGLYPIWFAQSTLAHADIFAAAFTLWGLVYALPERDRKPWAAALWFTAAALSKETAIAIPLTLAMVRVVEGLRARPPVRYQLWREAAWLSSCVAAAGGLVWLALRQDRLPLRQSRILRYNAQATLAPERVLAAFVHRVLHLTAHMNMFVPVLLTIAAMMLQPRTDAEGHERPGISASVRRSILILLLVNALLFSVLGGALLCRYLLPMYPLVLLLAVSTFHRRVPYWQALAVLSAAAFVAGLFVNPPYGFAPEDNLAYAHVIRLHQAGIAQLGKRFPGATVLSAWPVTDELRRPELGYVKQPFDVYAIDDFSAAANRPSRGGAGQIFRRAGFFHQVRSAAAAAEPGPAQRRIDERYFGLHHDLSPRAIARQLGGTLMWYREDPDQGQWIGLIRFNRQFEAALDSARRPVTGLHRARNL